MGRSRRRVDRNTGAWPDNIAAADLNGDGKVDLIVRGSGLSLLVNDGSGALLDHVDYALDAQPYFHAALAVGDVTGDGTPDVVAIGGSRVAALAGEGDGTLLSARTTVVLPGSTEFTGVAVGDVNGDHVPDRELPMSSWLSEISMVTAGSTSLRHLTRVASKAAPL